MAAVMYSAFVRHARFSAFACLLLACVLSGCVGRVSTEEIRASYTPESLEPLREELEDTHESYNEMVTALNLARVCQLAGRWRESIRRYEQALTVLEEYERRAVVNIRAMASGAGTILFSRGAQEYFGTGFERSLLHTFNALNYLMLGDFNGAAVEMRRMEKRQEHWLEESQARIEKNLASAGVVSSPDDLPGAYSMRELLRNNAVRNLINNYQDAFSYALSAILLRLAGDVQAADVAMRRAMALDANAANLFSEAWGGGATGGDAAAEPAIAIPLLPPKLRSGEIALDAPPPDVPDTQEVTILAFTGLAPALGVEYVRIWFPAIGYILVDLPAYAGPVPGTEPEVAATRVEKVVFYPLLRTDALAYRTLWDEVRLETASAYSRATVRAGIAAAAYASAASHKDTREFASLIGGLTTVMLDLFATASSGSVRNWETLPNTGYLAMTRIPRGGMVTIGSGERARHVSLPAEARGGIIVITELVGGTMKVNYVTY